MITPLARLLFIKGLLIGICFLHGHLDAQVPKIRFERYAVPDGLPGTYVFSILQDEQGFIWFATHGGLVKYDGYDFTTYKPSSLDTDANQLKLRGLGGGLLKGQDGTIWIGGTFGIEIKGGLVSYDPQTGQFTHHLEDSLLYPGLESYYYVAIADLRENIWFVNQGKSLSSCSLCRYRPGTQQLSRFPCSYFKMFASKELLSSGSAPFAEASIDSSIWLLDFSYNLQRYVPELDSFVTVVAAGTTLPGTSIQETLRGMYRDRQGMLLMYGDKGIYQWDPRKQKVLRYFVKDTLSSSGLPDGKIQYSFEDVHGRYWVMNTESAFSIIDPQTGESTRYNLGEGALNFAHAPKNLKNSTFLLSDEEGVIWTLTWPNGVFAGYMFYDIKTNTFDFYDIHFNLKENPFRKDRYRPYYVFRDRSKLLWLGKKWDGIFRQEPKKQMMNLYRHDPNDKYSLPSDWVLKILEDDQHRIWLATTKGLARYIPEQDRFKVFQHDSQNPNTLCNDRITDIFQDSDGQIWVATRGGINRWKEATASFERFLYTGTNNHTFISLMEDTKGRLWVSEMGDRVWVLDRKTGKPIKYFKPGESNSLGLTSKWITLIYQDMHENIWMGTYSPNEHGLFRLNASEDSLFVYRKEDGDSAAISNNQAHVFVEDSLGRLWIGTNGGGLYSYDASKDSFSLYPDLFNFASLPAYAEGPNKQLWFKTYMEGGLGKLHAQSRTITLYKQEKGGLNGSQYLQNRLAIGPSGKIWMPLDNCLSVFDPASQGFTNYFQKDGFQPYSAHYSNLASSDGQIWIGGHHGLNRIQPQKLLIKDSIPPQVEVTSVGIAGTAYQKPDGEIFTKMVSYTDEIQLRHDQNDLSFEFTALHYLRSEDNQYAWKLENYDDDWTTPSLDRKASYTNLDPGTYTFRVKASNADGIWNEEGASLTIIINPPWWATWWARSAFIALILGLIYLIYRYQLSRQLEHAENLRLKELDAVKTSLYTNITHEFRTPLTVISGMADQIEPPQEAQKLIRRNSKQLLHLVNQMLDLAKLESGKLELNLIQGNIVPYLHYLTEAFQSYAESKEIELVFYTEEPEIIMDYDEEKIQHVVTNLISNALKFSPSGSKVVLHVRHVEEAEKLVFNVQDHGIGIPEDKISHIFDRFYQVDDSSTRKGEGTGIGLTFTRELVNLMGGTIEVKSQVNKGSTFTVSLPISREAAVVTKMAKPDMPEMIMPISQAASSNLLLTNSEQDNILIIEDNPDVILYIKSCLEDQYQLLEAENGAIGIEKALEHTPDLIISDVMMPEKDGYEVCQVLKQDERSSHIPIILLTAKADMDSRIAGLEEGADAYLTKPFEKKELLVRINQLIQLRKNLQVRYRDRHGDALIPDEKYKREDSFLRKVKLLIEERLTEEDLSVDLLARELGLSRSQLFRKIKALTGHSVLAFIRTYRLQRAQQLLKSTRLSVSEIAYEVGFKNPNHFSAAFKTEFGTPPGATRK